MSCLICTGGFRAKSYPGSHITVGDVIRNEEGLRGNQACDFGFFHCTAFCGATAVIELTVDNIGRIGQDSSINSHDPCLLLIVS